MTQEEIKLACGESCIIGDSIIENTVKSQYRIEIKDVDEIRLANMKLMEGRPYGVLVVSGLYSSISKETREYSSQKDYNPQVKALAIVVQTLSQKLIARFFITVNKPATKTQYFTDRDKAIEWLEDEMKS